MQCHLIQPQQAFVIVCQIQRDLTRGTRYQFACKILNFWVTAKDRSIYRHTIQYTKSIKCIQEYTYLKKDHCHSNTDKFWGSVTQYVYEEWFHSFTLRFLQKMTHTVVKVSSFDKNIALYGTVKVFDLKCKVTLVWVRYRSYTHPLLCLFMCRIITVGWHWALPVCTHYSWLIELVPPSTTLYWFHHQVWV